MISPLPQATLFPALPALKRLVWLAGCIWLVYGCSSPTAEAPDPVPNPTFPTGKPTVSFTAEVAMKWGDMALRVTTRTPANTPTYASRAFGYLGLAMYETTVHGIPDHQSLARQLTGLRSLPLPQTDSVYNWPLALNAGQAYMLKNLYEHTPAANKTAVDSLEAALRMAYGDTLKPAVVARSVAFGRAVATALHDWSKDDGGHQGYKDPFPTDYQLATSPGSWVPPFDGQVAIRRALHPRWGNNRTFAPTNTGLTMPKPAAYSTSPSSDYYKFYQAVYTKNRQLTQAEKEIALWWADDPSQTFTPPGHSYNLATITVRTTKANLAKAVETYARVGMAVTDAFINCWKCKYTYTNERPSSFVRANIDRTWFPFWPEPPFPGFSSGHATQSAATATVLTGLYGENIALVDDSHQGRPRDAFRNVDFKNRSFPSFWATAEESAYSRFLGGIHTQQDNDTGLKEGKVIGSNINQFQWLK